MGIFGGMFGKSEDKPTSKLDWNYLESMGDLDKAAKLSHQKTVVLFKHSTRCSISRFVLKQFENTYDIPADKMEIYFLDLIEYRPISAEIAERFGVTHQSPQMIVLKDEKAVYDSSHESIDAKALDQFV
jgi:bacillithiol system protein YtxJ